MRVDILKALLSSSAFSTFVATYNFWISLFLGLSTVTVMILFFVSVTRLSTASDNEARRRDAIQKIVVCLVCFAILASIDLVYAVLLGFVFGGGV